MSDQLSFLGEGPQPSFELIGAPVGVPAVAQTVVAAARSPLKKSELDDYRGAHRMRLRQRFEQGGADAVPDYELLEMILYRPLARVDTKPIAKRLISEFGDLNRVLAASPARLKRVHGVGDAVVLELKLMESVGHRMARAKVIDKPILSSWDALLDYCRASMAHRELEQFRVLYLDRKNCLIADDLQQTGTVDHVPVYPREVVKRALELNASALILVHNHPSGDPTPSESDLTMTRAICDAAEVLGLVVHDHLIIGKAREISFRAEGYL
ncbi:MAG: DNA repair protein RadC [Paracoccaceae bacterium]|jgi:DNA repair protein RadC